MSETEQETTYRQATTTYTGASADVRSAQEGSVRRGLLVALEGIDGAGKTTAMHGSAAILRARGIPALAFDKKQPAAGTRHSDYARRRLHSLRDLIWGNRPDDPYLQLGDMHWVCLQAAWYSAVSHCVIAPLLAAGETVITDTWGQKFLAKLALRPDVDFAAVARVFADLRQPDLVVRLALDASTAAARKDVFAISESGNDERTAALTTQGFITYQQRLDDVLTRWSVRHGWPTVDANGLTPAETAEAVAAHIERRAAEGHPVTEAEGEGVWRCS